MSMNYYLKREDAPYLSEEERHICKLSRGWKPLFQGNALIRNLDGWRALLETLEEVEDERGESLPVSSFWDHVAYYESLDGTSHRKNFMNVVPDADGNEFCFEEFC